MSVSSAQELMDALRGGRGFAHITITEHLDMRGKSMVPTSTLVATNRTESIQVRLHKRARMLTLCRLLLLACTLTAQA